MEMARTRAGTLKMKRQRGEDDPSPPRPITLPTEVFMRIIAHLGNDKHSLSQCMRVSTTFNSLTAPHLYRSIKIGRTTKNFFAIPKMTRDQLAFRQSQVKAINMTYVKEIEYEGHARTFCLTNADARHWRWLALQPSVFTFTDGSHPGSGGCDCIRYISSCKLPLENCLRRYRDEHRPSGAESESDTTVSVATNPKDLYLLPLKLDCLYRHKSPNLNKSIFIWSFNHPNSTLLAGPPWDLFLQRLFGAAKLATCPNDIILVNFEAVANRHVSLEDGKDMTPLQVANDTVQKAYLAHLTTIHPVSYPGIKSVEQARQVKFTFLSMTTYLAEYDWKGELTEEQVRPWLGDKVKGQS